jgi:hypothetical protein
MEPLCKDIDEFKRQLQKGSIQRAYKSLMDYILGLRTHFEAKFPEYSVAGSIYHGYMDMTYFALFPEALKQRKLKIAIVFVYDTFRFEVWLSGFNKQVQAKYWKLFRESAWNKYLVVPTLEGADSIVEHVAADDPDFGDGAALTKKIEKTTVKFIEDIEKFLSPY